MFLIEAKGKSGLWKNSLNDDFLRFLPDYFGCSAEELSVRFLSDSIGNELEIFSQQDKCRLEMGGGIVKKIQKQKVTVIEQVEETQTLEDGTSQTILVPKETEEEQDVILETIQTSEVVSSWPYQNQNGNLVFLGIFLKP